MRARITQILILLTLFSSCYQDHLYVQQEWVDASFLASTHVGTPDPRQECPPTGQRLLVAWKFPRRDFCQNLTLHLTVRFWDQLEEVICYPMERAWSSTAFDFFDKRILTYRIQVMNACDEVIETWEHHFWTELIDFDQ